MDNSPITIFTNTEFGNVRTHTDENGTLWFVARDVANILGYHNTKKAIIDHVDDDEKMDGVTIRCASPSAMAVLPTPGSPMRTGLFLFLRDRIWITRLISV